MSERYYVQFISDETAEYTIRAVEWNKCVPAAHGQLYFANKADANAFVVGYMARRVARLKRQLEAAEKAMNSATHDSR